MVEGTDPIDDPGLVRIPGSVPEPGVEREKPIAPYERKVGNWLNAYMEFTKESESPDNYHIWCGLSALSAVAQRSVWVDQGIYILFPNLYVALVGPPGRTAKSTALYLSRGLVSNVSNVKLGPDSVTREQLIRAMAEAKLNNQCAMSIYSTEFSSLIGPSGILMIQLLMDLYDCNYTDSKKGWDYQTKHQGKDNLINPFLSGLFCTTPSYLAESIPDNIIGHGFTSRMIFVHEEQERLVNPRPKPNDMILAQRLVDDLRHINHISGQFKWTPEAETEYDEFYRQLYKTVPEDHRLEGYHWRKKIHVLKVAMLLAMAESDDLTLYARDIKAAVQLLHDLEHNMARVFSGVGKYENASEAERVGNFIRSRPDGIKAADVYTRFYHVGEVELSKIISLLIKMRAIEVRGKLGSEIYLPIGQKLPWQL